VHELYNAGGSPACKCYVKAFAHKGCKAYGGDAKTSRILSK
jgi:hypothetical protein